MARKYYCSFSFVKVRDASHNPFMRRRIFPGAQGRRWPISIARGHRAGDAWTPYKTRHIWLHVLRYSYGIKMVSMD